MYTITYTVSRAPDVLLWQPPGTVRIDAFRILNFRGIEHAEMQGLADEPVIAVSGPNGAGKSLLFEAIALLWRINTIVSRQQVIPSALIGPWADTCEIEVTVALADEEITALSQHAKAAGLPEPESDRAPIGIRLTHEGGPLDLIVDNWASPLSRLDFTTTHGFANVDYFPADRAFPRGEQAQVNPGLLTDEQRESFRDQIVGSFAQQRSLVNLSGIAPLLASLDYVDLLADREKTPSSGDFDALTGAFAASTSKVILRPTLDQSSAQGAVIRVRTPAGHLHSIDQLSSGEQEVLGLSYFVRRLSARGGVLLIDEPELHLHPSLQRTLFSALEATADRAQVWIATHSPRLITATPLDAIIHAVPAAGKGTNQTSRASDETDRLRLLDDLGVHPIEAFQSDALLVLEGTTDPLQIGAFLPLELGRSATVIGGDATGVETVVKSMNAADLPIPHIGIRDRDYLTDAEATALEKKIPNLFVWSLRSVENEILSPPLISKTLQRAGAPMTAASVNKKLRDLAKAQREIIQAELTDARLHSQHAYTKGGKTALEQRKHYLQEVQRVAGEKLGEFDKAAAEVAADLQQRWMKDFLKLVDGKRLFSEFVALTPFSSSSDLRAALAQTAHDHPELLPPGLQRLRDRIHKLLPASH